MSIRLVVEVEGVDQGTLDRLLEWHKDKNSFLLIGQPERDVIRLGYGDVLDVKIINPRE